MTATFPYLCDWGPSPTVDPARRSVSFGDGYEQRASSSLNPFLASYDLTFSNRTQAEAQAIQGWLMANQAHVLPFYWDPAWFDTVATGEQFGKGDGSRVQWQLTKNGIPAPRDLVVSGVYRQDWQGNVLLRPVSRTNQLTYTEGTATWTVRGATTQTSATENRPDGTSGAVLTLAGIGTAGTDDAHTLVASVCVKGARYEPSAWVKLVSGSGTMVLRDPVGGAGASGWWLINSALLGTGWNRITRSHPAVSVTNEFVCGANLGVGIWFAAVTGGPFTVKVVWQQHEQGAIPGAYISNPASTRNSLTDYTLGAGGIVTLGQVPVSGAVLSWSGSGKTAFGWIADKWSPAKPDAYNSWSINATFRQVPL